MKKRADNLNFNFKEKNKKAQVTIIIIIAIVLITVIILFFVFRTKILPTPESKISEVKDINRVLENCIEQRAIDAIMLIGLQGGYAGKPEKSANVGNFNVAYGLHNNKNTLVSLSKIEDEISDYIKSRLPLCINNQDFAKLAIDQGTPNAKSRIRQNNVEISASLPLSIAKGNKTITIDRNYEFTIPIRLGKIHKTANEIIIKHLENPELIDLTFLIELEFDVIFSHYTETDLIYTITDEKSQIEEIPYSFMFVVEGK